MPKAFTRAVSPRLSECELTHQERVPLDAGRAAAQHDAYERALTKAGYEVIRLPDLPDHPDAVFVEDTALLLGSHAVILRPGAASRSAETISTAEGLAPHFELHRITQGQVDGGDVLRIGRTLYVGRSARTDEAGITALREVCGPLGYDLLEATLRDCLHLKTGATLAGTDRAGNAVLIHSAQSIDPAQFAGVVPMAVHADETAAANCLRVGDRLILPAGNPRTAEHLRDRGFQVIEVDVSELQKAEAGVTCMSLIAD
ncbi:MAG: dimethylargininase [Sphingomonas sp.]|nr:dimethylargininase [Sphingomonas sp.]